MKKLKWDINPNKYEILYIVTVYEIFLKINS